MRRARRGGRAVGRFCGRDWAFLDERTGRAVAAPDCSRPLRDTELKQLEELDAVLHLAAEEHKAALALAAEQGSDSEPEDPNAGPNESADGDDSDNDSETDLEEEDRRQQQRRLGLLGKEHEEDEDEDEDEDEESLAVSSLSMNGPPILVYKHRDRLQLADTVPKALLSEEQAAEMAQNEEKSRLSRRILRDEEQDRPRCSPYGRAWFLDPEKWNYAAHACTAVRKDRQFQQHQQEQQRQRQNDQGQEQAPREQAQQGPARGQRHWTARESAQRSSRRGRCPQGKTDAADSTAGSGPGSPKEVIRNLYIGREYTAYIQRTGTKLPHYLKQTKLG